MHRSYFAKKGNNVNCKSFPRISLAIIAALVFMVIFSPKFAPESAAAQQQCQQTCEATIAAIKDARLGRGEEQKLIAKVENACRKYYKAAKNSEKQAQQQLDIALQQLDSPAYNNIIPQTREVVRNAIQSLKGCIDGAPPVQTATLTVNTYLPSDLAADGRGGIAGAGVIIQSANVEYGVTGVDGTATVRVPAGTHVVKATLYPSNMGESEEITLAAGEVRTIDIILEEGKEPSEDTTLVLDEAPDGVLNRDFKTFTLRFQDGITTSALTDFEEVSINPFGESPRFVESMFALQPDGSLAARDVAALKNLLLQHSGAIELRVHGYDARGRTHSRTVSFYLSRYRVQSKLIAPPSFPGLNVSRIYMTATILNTDLVFNAVSDASGMIAFPLLPSGNLEFRSETLQNGKYYYGQGILVLDGDKSLTVNMLYTDDLVAGIPEFTAQPLSQLSTTVAAASSVIAATDGDGASEERLAAHARYEAQIQNEAQTQNEAKGAFMSALESTNASVYTTAESTDVSVYVSAGQQNQPMAGTATYNVAKGTKSVTLAYNISTAEYPYYVQSQSIYNDTWSLVVRGGGSGQQKFYIPRQINSQLSSNPVWQSNGSTGEIKEVLDVESLAANSDATLTLFASAMNVGDSILPTSVQASLGKSLTLQVNSVTPDTVAPTRGDSSYYSIPRPGQLNTYHRFFTVQITKPATATVKRVKVRIGDQNNNSEMMTVLEEGPGTNVTVNGNTLRVRVTMGPRASAINSTPPPTWRHFYRFDVTVEENGREVSAYKDSGRRNPLWRMPDNFARYSTRDRGEDDWCTHGVYRWMEQNRHLLRAINDISGEHARDIGHSTHQSGRDIDMYHFYTFPGATTGGDNFIRFRNAVVAATNGDAPARQQVLGFVNATRQGIDSLAALNTVVLMYYMEGNPISGLPDDWATTLFRTGRITRATATGTQTLDLGIGNWNNSKYHPRDDHHDHVHIALSPAL